MTLPWPSVCRSRDEKRIYKRVESKSKQLENKFESLNIYDKRRLYFSILMHITSIPRRQKAITQLQKDYQDEKADEKQLDFTISTYLKSQTLAESTWKRMKVRKLEKEQQELLEMINEQKNKFNRKFQVVLPEKGRGMVEVKLLVAKSDLKWQKQLVSLKRNYLSKLFELLEIEHSDSSFSSAGENSPKNAKRVITKRKKDRILSTGIKRRRANLPKEKKKVLQAWFESNIENPYPNEEIKDMLAKRASIKLEQVNNWFINERVRNQAWKNLANNR